MRTEQYIKFYHINEKGDAGEYVYRLSKSAGIEIRKVSDDLTLLKLYFTRLVPLEKSVEEFESWTELMLTNYPIEFRSLAELEGKVIEIKDGWTREVSFTMLSFGDGEPTNDNKISFRHHSENSLWIEWTGTYTDYASPKGSRFELCMIVTLAGEIVTPLCSYDHELEKLFGEKRIADLSPMD